MTVPVQPGELDVALLKLRRGLVGEQLLARGAGSRRFVSRNRRRYLKHIRAVAKQRRGARRGD